MKLDPILEIDGNKVGQRYRILINGKELYLRGAEFGLITLLAFLRKRDGFDDGHSQGWRPPWWAPSPSCNTLYKLRKEIASVIDWDPVITDKHKTRDYPKGRGRRINTAPEHIMVGRIENFEKFGDRDILVLYNQIQERKGK